MKNTGSNIFGCSGIRAKVTNHTAQKRKFSAYLFRNVATCTMASEAIGIPQKNLTRYKRQMEKAGTLIVVFKGICKISGSNRVQYLSCNPIYVKAGGYSNV